MRSSIDQLHFLFPVSISIKLRFINSQDKKDKEHPVWEITMYIVSFVATAAVSGLIYAYRETLSKWICCKCNQEAQPNVQIQAGRMRQDAEQMEMMNAEVSE